MLLLPVSVPLWVMWMAALLTATAALSLWKPLGIFLTAPPEPLRSYGYYGHHHEPTKPPPLALVDRDAA